MENKANNIPKYILEIYKKIIAKNFQVYLVGGCIRNLLLSKDVKDWDMTTNATPEQILQIFPDGFYDNDFGTVGIPMEKNVIEITTFRTEQNYLDSRHPTSVKWGKTIEEDLQRRDFTVNAIAYDIRNDAIIDPFKGQLDLKNRIIKAVGEPTKRFKEDALRLMRAVRLATQLNFIIEEKTKNAIIQDAVLLEQISSERIRDEFLKIIESKNATEGIIMLKDMGLLKYILPELLDGLGISQVRPGRHHIHDVFTHNLMSLKFCPSSDPIIKFTALVHDIGKPFCISKDEDNLIIFHNHEIVGAKIAYQICERLKFSKKEREKIVKLIRWHMFTVDEYLTDSAIRRFIRKIGVENVSDMIDLRIADRLGSGISSDKAESWRLKKFKERIEEQLKPAPFSINDLALDGNDVMKILNLKPGRKIGEILQKLFIEVDEDLNLNTKDYLEKRIKDLG